MDPQKELANAWRNEMIPLLNGVTYPDGRWFQMSEDLGELKVTETRWDTRDMGDQWTYFAQLCRESVPGNHLEVSAGEGGMGSDGIVALIDSRDNSLRWVLFSDLSNPFHRLEIRDKQILAETTLDTRWTIDLQKPENAFLWSVNG
ncbi:hypothetical protein C5Y93_14495 [Blastopirellula marina]|uniref:Uncharacterized protein n=2 Tax=Blastopirellula marina TaxID=124 RepID=A0A2S8GMQ6_9BACT|nr:hypothetical protein C5Y93_14495 [Blastopirellula marina]